MEIKFITLDGQKFELTFEEDVTIHKIREKLLNECSFNTDRCYFCRSGKILDDESISKESFGSDAPENPIIIFNYQTFPDKSYPKVDSAFELNFSRYHDIHTSHTPASPSVRNSIPPNVFQQVINIRSLRSHQDSPNRHFPHLIRIIHNSNRFNQSRRFNATSNISESDDEAEHISNRPPNTNQEYNEDNSIINEFNLDSPNNHFRLLRNISISNPNGQEIVIPVLENNIDDDFPHNQFDIPNDFLHIVDLDNQTSEIDQHFDQHLDEIFEEPSQNMNQQNSLFTQGLNQATEQGTIQINFLNNPSQQVGAPHQQTEQNSMNQQNQQNAIPPSPPLNQQRPVPPGSTNLNRIRTGSDLDMRERELNRQIIEGLNMNVVLGDEDNQAISRLVRAGYDRATVIQVYEACDRNEENAMNILVSMG